MNPDETAHAHLAHALRETTSPDDIEAAVRVLNALASDDLAALTARMTLDAAGVLFNVLALIAEFEADLIRAGTHEGLEHARQQGRLRGGKAKLSPLRRTQFVRDHQSGNYTMAQLTEMYAISRATAYRVIAAARDDGEGE